MHYHLMSPSPWKTLRIPLGLALVAVLGSLAVGFYIVRGIRTNQEHQARNNVREVVNAESRRFELEFQRFQETFTFTLSTLPYEELVRKGEVDPSLVVPAKRFLFLHRALLRELRLELPDGRGRVLTIRAGNYLEISPSMEIRAEPTPAPGEISISGRAGECRVTAVLTPESFIRDALADAALRHPNLWFILIGPEGLPLLGRRGSQTATSIEFSDAINQRLREDTQERFAGELDPLARIDQESISLIGAHTPLSIGKWHSLLLLAVPEKQVLEPIAVTTRLLSATAAGLGLLLAGLVIWFFRGTRASQLEIEAARKRLDGIWQTVQNAILLVDLRDGRILDANPAANALLNLPAGDHPVGRDLTEFLPACTCLQATLAPVVGAECPLTQPDGSPARFALVNTSILSIAQPPLIVCALSDITALRESKETLLATQQKLRASLETAEAAVRVKAEFLANMSHEIRTPMNAVIGMTELLQHTPLSPQQAEFTGTIRNSGEALLSLISDILDFSKIDSGKLELEAVPFNLRDCIENALELSVSAASAKHLELLLWIEDDVPEYLNGDVTRIRQILVNLVSNAVKFTEKGQVLVTCSHRPASTTWNSPRLHFSVQDTGIGIPPDQQDRLFQAFSQIDASTSRKYGGTGLGLTICLRLVKLMQGRVWVESSPGQGANFQFEIPLKPAPTPPTPTTQAIAGAVPALRDRRILIVDDNATNLRILDHLLRRWGLVTMTANSGQAALALIDAGEIPEAALLDMQMPHMDGHSLTAELRRRTATANLPIAVLSSLGHSENMRTDLRIRQVLTKPAKAAALLETLQTLLAPDPPPHPETHATGRDHPPAPTRELDPSVSILLAEDNPINQRVASLLLRRLGHNCLTAANGLEVLDTVARQPIDIILLDVQMPEMDGLICARQLNALYPPVTRPWIIALTANALDGDREICLSAGMDDYLAKPINSRALANALEQAMPRLRARRAQLPHTPGGGQHLLPPTLPSF